MLQMISTDELVKSSLSH